ncbi:hypothetical protein PLEOSDRAFT_161035 [Pleurotus ostreatus PC15]|uniref:Uncharacterized protein n=1 Tax=Pleurotus ostreatus (strain PC15) TaxID=1137138 RepID=A0A067NLE7_PLEO1|nr:hypothetical protein PLEOSDRAFT_161035 [Pleurotus ostreatus PC15]
MANLHYPFRLTDSRIWLAMDSPHSPVPPITMRVALFVLAFAAVFVLASPNADKKKKVKKPTAAPADAAPPADAPPADDAAAA